MLFSIQLGTLLWLPMSAHSIMASNVVSMKIVDVVHTKHVGRINRTDLDFCAGSIDGQCTAMLAMAG
jgi:hypothetical protein